MLLRYAALIERFVAFRWEGVCVKRDKGVLRAVLLERVVESEEACEVGGVGYEGGPYWKMLVPSHVG
jgi:hypothetical protein